MSKYDLDDLLTLVPETLDDGGFSAHVTGRVERLEWMQRVSVPLSAMAAALVAFVIGMPDFSAPLSTLSPMAQLTALMPPLVFITSGFIIARES